MVLMLNQVEPGENMVEGIRVSRVSGCNSLNPRREVSFAVRLKSLAESGLHLISILLDLALIFDYALESQGRAVVCVKEAGSEANNRGNADGPAADKSTLAFGLDVLRPVQKQWRRAGEQSPLEIVGSTEIANNFGEVRVDIDELSRVSRLEREKWH